MPLALLNSRLTANLQALYTRNADLAATIESLAPSREYCILPQADRILLGAKVAGCVQPLPEHLTPPAARDITTKLYPSGKCEQPIVVAGEDLGWLWNYL